VSAVGDERRDGWLARLSPALYPSEADKRAPIEHRPAGCPEFGDDSVYARPPRAPARERSVAPGLHRAEAGDHRVVWWDPSRLILDVQDAMGLRQNKLLQADESGEVSNVAVEAYRQWRELRETANLSASVPQHRVEIATRLVPGGEDEETITIGSVVQIDQTRPHGTRFGSLVHALMMRLAFDADSDAIEAAARVAARIDGASVAEVEAAIVAASNAFATPIVDRARRSPRVMREHPLVARSADGTIIEGVADLIFQDPDSAELVVVDFKTDLSIDARLGEYRAQVAFYVRAIAAATGLPARGVILRI
jgi:ATP-dependent exoDNAse (exonuclease V) beta subunit